MTTELVLLLCIVSLIGLKATFGEKGPVKVMANSVPRLGARLEQNIAIGHQFNVRDDNRTTPGPTEWTHPSGAAPTGAL